MTRGRSNAVFSAAASLAVVLAAVAALSSSPASAGTDFNGAAADPVARPLTLAEKYAILYEQRIPVRGF